MFRTDVLTNTVHHFTTEDEKMSDAFQEYWTQFVKTR